MQINSIADQMVEQVDEAFLAKRSDYINNILKPRAENVCDIAYNGVTYEKKFQKKFSPYTGLTDRQMFTLELDCLMRVNEVINSEGLNRHFPKLISFDMDNLKIVMSSTGTALASLSEVRDCSNLEFQVKTISYTLSRSGVQHADIVPRNVTIDPDGIISLIDFDISSIDGCFVNKKIESICGESRGLDPSLTICKLIRENKLINVIV